MTAPQLPGTRVRTRRGDAEWEVRAERLADLRSLAAVSVDCGRLTCVDVTLARWHAPGASWVGHPRVADVTSCRIEPKGDGVHVRLEVAQPLDAAVLLAGAVRCLMPVPRDRGPLLTFAPGLPASAGILAGHLHDVLASGEDRDRHVRRCDILLAPDGAAEGVARPEVERVTTVRIGESAWLRDGSAFDVCVDPSIQRPLGRRSVGGTAIATASIVGGVVTLTSGSDRLVLGRSVTASSTRALRSIGAVVGEGLPEAVRHQLQACGVLVVADADGLPDPDDHLAWQALSVHERRHALRKYGPWAALDAWPEVSVLLVTHRMDFLDHAFAQVRALSYPRLEVVIGAHGPGVDEEQVRVRARDLPFPVTVVGIDGALTLGEALQRVSDRATGDLLTKMDDDDVYGPEHIWDLVLARQYSGAEVVGKALDWVHLESSDVTVFRPTYPAEKYADFVAGGTILISRGDLAGVGGWRPVPRSVDRALLDRVLADGGLVYRTHGLGYVYVRRASGHTASVSDEHFLTKVTATYPGLVRHAEFGTQA